jgi:tetratricopeptide (TPR) repeat protein
MPDNRYTPAMLADLVGVRVARIRYWQKQGWIVPAEQTHRLALFDFAELTVARKLAELTRAGATASVLKRQLPEIKRRYPDVARPLAELSLVIDGRTLLVRRGSDLLDADGQLRLDFHNDDSREDPPATIASPAFLLDRRSSLPPADAAPARLAALAADLDEAGDLTAAAEAYRAALAAGGPHPELCFQLADVLYRAGDTTAARERYFQALELDEDYIEARVNLGCVLRELGELELAASAFAGALHSHEAYADAHYHLAGALEALDRAEEAQHHWQRFFALAPDSPWASEASSHLTDHAHSEP